MEGLSPLVLIPLLHAFFLPIAAISVLRSSEIEPITLLSTSSRFVGSCKRKPRAAARFPQRKRGMGYS
eukprot:4195136-Amphidinium_carterae.1